MIYHTGGAEVLLDRRGREIQSGVGSPSATLEEKWFAPTANKLRDISRNRITDTVLRLKERRDNWDFYGSAAANNTSINEAIDALEAFVLACADQGLDWLDPHVGLNEDGCVVFEWWRGDRRLTIYFSPQSPEYVCSWGPNIESQMDAGLFSQDCFAKLWRWLSTVTS